MTAAKELGMPYSPLMVRAIKAKLKTQTRRIAPISALDIKDYGDGTVTWRVQFAKAQRGTLASYSGGKFTVQQARSIIASQFCRYGKPGTRIWVQEEAWFDREPVDGMPLRRFVPDSTDVRFADGRAGVAPYAAPRELLKLNGSLSRRPPFLMPRWASRHTLETVSASVERLNDITEADCIAEGCPGGHGAIPGYAFSATPSEHYRWLWEHLNGKGSWDLNPYVWVINFKDVS